MQRAEDNGQTFEPLIDVKPATGSTRRRLASTLLSPVRDHHHDGHRRDPHLAGGGARRERGTMEALLSTEITRTELLCVSSYPTISSGCWRCCCVCCVGVYSRRAVSRVAADSVFYPSLFLLSTLGMGLLISTITRTSSMPLRSP